jgi:hypothetical protein
VPRGHCLYIALPSPPQCHAALGMMPHTLAWMDYCPCYQLIDVPALCNVDTRGWLLEGNLLKVQVVHCGKQYSRFALTLEMPASDSLIDQVGSSGNACRRYLI